MQILNDGSPRRESAEVSTEKRDMERESLKKIVLQVKSTAGHYKKMGQSRFPDLPRGNADWLLAQQSFLRRFQLLALLIIHLRIAKVERLQRIDHHG